MKRPTSNFSTTKTKVLAPGRAAAWSAKLRGKKVVFTNGCFDLLHVGHVTYLEQARSLGTHLIVALNSDESVRRLKGKDRPLVTLKERARVMAALSCVDAVTWFTNDTPLAIIKKVRPAILVKGGDWAIDSIVGAKEVIADGGKVYSLGFVDGKSTTKLIEKAKKSK